MDTPRQLLMSKFCSSFWRPLHDSGRSENYKRVRRLQDVQSINNSIVTMKSYSNRNTMQAAVYKPGTPLLSIVDDFPIPEVKPHQVLLKVRACGVCHTDVSL